MLCTSDKTFALKLVETTNTLLLLPPQQVWVTPLVMRKQSCWQQSHQPSSAQQCGNVIHRTYNNPTISMQVCVFSVLLQELDEDFAAIPSLATPGQQ